MSTVEEQESIFVENLGKNILDKLCAENYLKSLISKNNVPLTPE